MADELHGIVQRMIDAGEPEENIASVIKEFHPATPVPAAQQRSRTGALYTPPAASGELATFGKSYAEGFNPMGIVDTAKAAYNDPVGTAKEVAKTPYRIMGKLVGGHAPEALGELGSMITLGGLADALPGIRKAPVAPPEMINGVSVADLKAAGVGDPALDAMRNGRPKPTGVLRTAAKPAPEPAPQTVGNLALKPEYQPVDAPIATPSPMQPQGAVTPTRQMELMQKFGGTADPGKPLGPPRVMTLKDTPTSWTPEAARARIEFNDWHANVGMLKPEEVQAMKAAGYDKATIEALDKELTLSPEAKDWTNAHQYDAETQSRYKYLLDSKNGFGRADLIANPARVIPGLAMEGLARYFHLPPMVGGAVGYAAPEIAAGAKAAAQSPTGNQALRAALLARMLAQGADTANPR